MTLTDQDRNCTGDVLQDKSVKVIDDWNELLNDLDIKVPKSIPQLTEPLTFLS